jgi:hypothetical protein
MLILHGQELTPDNLKTQIPDPQKIFRHKGRGKNMTFRFYSLH